ncbi:CCA tRNA nucleotidyltransferase [Sulfurimonas gotlandica]|uniref:CCA tRNA nucleotidyltransferase n=1 Tax=Sulfurimonas gotlandica TaxID=1176482 RepID=UPI001F51E9EB|nr:CCA tRNA nucleotidyltransferase [Sulfurimonas gotlandica]
MNKIFEKLENNGARAIIIGGFIRDFLLNIDSDDIDIEVYNVSSFEKLENILKEFGSINKVGKSFGVCKLKIDNFVLDFTLPRIDSKISSGHSGFDVKIEKDLDFITATRRRDFTINAIGYDVVNKTILDPFNGINDLNDKTLKMVDTETFIEDPLRVLRAVQFCSRFNLKMDKELFLLSKTMIKQNSLCELAKERIYDEIKKNLLKSTKPSLGFELLKELGALKYFPSLALREKQTWYCSMHALDKIVQLKTTNDKTNEILMLASLCYDFNSFQIQDFISKLSNDKEILNRVLVLVENLNAIKSFCLNSFNDYDLFKLSTKVNIEEIIILSESLYGLGNNIKKRAKELNILNKQMPAFLRGRDLITSGMKPSCDFSDILEDAYEAQMHGKFSSHKDAITWLRSYLLNHQ